VGETRDRQTRTGGRLGGAGNAAGPDAFGLSRELRECDRLTPGAALAV